MASSELENSITNYKPQRREKNQMLVSLANETKTLKSNAIIATSFNFFLILLVILARETEIMKANAITTTSINFLLISTVNDLSFVVSVFSFVLCCSCFCLRQATNTGLLKVEQDESLSVVDEDGIRMEMLASVSFQE